jgi:small-conductance mechanosensitive channel
MQATISWFHELVSHDFPLFQLGKSAFTLGQLLAILVGVAVLFAVSSLLNRLLINRLLSHGHIDISTRYTIAALVRYTVLVVGFMVIMETAGINLTAFSVLAGAVGVGIGFGLQNIVSNFISGLIVMFERPIRIGDRIEVGGIEGDVLKIGARATHITTAEGNVVIMPNQKFVTEPVRNWADREGRSPLVLSVSVDKASDLRQAAELLNAAVREHRAVVKAPATEVWLTGVSGNPTFKIIAWVPGSAEERNRVTHDLYLSISETLARRDIRLA